jgi:glutathione S-transferase
MVEERIKLWSDAHFVSPWVGVVWAALEEKGLPFEVAGLDLGKGEQRKGDYPEKTITGKVPSIEHKEVWLAESSAIVEYLEEVFTPPAHRAIFPSDPAARARDRQIMAWLRSDLFELRRVWPFEGLFYPQPQVHVTEVCKQQAEKLVNVAKTRLDRKEPTIADFDLAIMLRRLVHYRHPFDAVVASWAASIWARPSLQSWVTHERPPTRRPYPPDRGTIDHLGVFVSDLERTRAFLEEHLGMSFVEHDEDESVWMTTLRAGAQEVHLFRSKVEGIAPGLDHVSVRVSEEALERLVRELPKRGVSISGPHRYKNTRYVKLNDPDGITWEVLSLSADR